MVSIGIGLGRCPLIATPRAGSSALLQRLRSQAPALVIVGPAEVGEFVCHP